MIKRFEFEDTINQMSDFIAYYKKYEIFKETNLVTLADGRKMKITFPKRVIAHLLGVDTNYLMGTGLFNEKKSFELLEHMCGDSYKIYTSMVNGYLSYEQLFSPYLDKKLEGIKDALRVNLFNNCFVCFYDKEKAWYNTIDGTNYTFDCALVTQTEKGIFMLGLVYDETVNSYVPKSNQYFSTMEEFLEEASKLKDQEFTFPTHLITMKDNNSRKFYLNPKHKEERMNWLMNITQMIGDVSINVSKDYLFALDKAITGYENGGSLNTEMAEMIADCIKNRKFISPDLFDGKFENLSSSLMYIITAHNNSLSTSISNDNKNANPEAVRHYAEVVEKNDALSKANDELTTENTNLREENEILKEGNRALIENLAKYREILCGIQDLLKNGNIDNAEKVMKIK